MSKPWREVNPKSAAPEDSIAPKPILYSYFRSSASWRVRIALAYKGIEYDYQPVNLIKDGGEQLTEDYEKLNPSRQVPTLVIDGNTLTQSLPIIEYLEETRPEKPLLPRNPVDRAQARILAEIINAGIQPIQNLSVLKMVGEISGDESKKTTWSKHWITRGFEAFEKIVGETSGKFCIGDNVTIADLCLVPQLLNARRNGVDMSKFLNINRIVEECSKVEAFRLADPTNQPDCPDDLKK